MLMEAPSRKPSTPAVITLAPPRAGAPDLLREDRDGSSSRDSFDTLCISGFGSRGAALNGPYDWSVARKSWVHTDGGHYEITPNVIGWLAHHFGDAANPMFKESGGSTVNLADTNVPPSKSWTHLSSATRYHVKAVCCEVGDDFIDNVFRGGTLDGSSGDVGMTVLAYSLFVLGLLSVVGCFCCIKRSKVHEKSIWFGCCPWLGRFEWKGVKEGGVQRHRIISPREQEALETVEKAIRGGELPVPKLPEISPAQASFRSMGTGKGSLTNTGGNQTHRSSIYSPDPPRPPFPAPDSLDQVGLMHQMSVYPPAPGQLEYDFSPGPWICELCGYGNPSQVDQCQACHRVRGYVPRRAHGGRNGAKKGYDTVDEMVRRAKREMKKAQPEIFGGDDATTDDTRSVVSMLSDGRGSFDGRGSTTGGFGRTTGTRGSSFYKQPEDKPSPLRTKPKEADDAGWDGTVDRAERTTNFKWFKGAKPFTGEYKEKMDAEKKKAKKKALDGMSPDDGANGGQAAKALQYWDQLMQGTYPGPDAAPVNEKYAGKILQRVTKDKDERNEPKAPKVTRDMRTRERMLNDFVPPPEQGGGRGEGPPLPDGPAGAPRTNSYKTPLQQRIQNLGPSQEHVRELKFFETGEYDEPRTPDSRAPMGIMTPNAGSPALGRISQLEEKSADLRRAGFSEDAIVAFEEREEAKWKREENAGVGPTIPMDFSHSPAKRKLKGRRSLGTDAAERERRQSQVVGVEDYAVTGDKMGTAVGGREQRDSYRLWNASALKENTLPEERAAEQKRGRPRSREDGGRPKSRESVMGKWLPAMARQNALQQQREKSAERERERSRSRSKERISHDELVKKRSKGTGAGGNGSRKHSKSRSVEEDPVVPMRPYDAGPDDFDDAGEAYLSASPDAKLRGRGRNASLNATNGRTMSTTQRSSATTNTNFYPPGMAENKWKNRELNKNLNAGTIDNPPGMNEADARDDLLNFSRPDPVKEQELDAARMAKFDAEMEKRRERELQESYDRAQAEVIAEVVEKRSRSPVKNAGQVKKAKGDVAGSSSSTLGVVQIARNAAPGPPQLPSLHGMKHRRSPDDVAIPMDEEFVPSSANDASEYNGNAGGAASTAMNRSSSSFARAGAAGGASNKPAQLDLLPDYSDDGEDAEGYLPQADPKAKRSLLSKAMGGMFSSGKKFTENVLGSATAARYVKSKSADSKKDSKKLRSRDYESERVDLNRSNRAMTKSFGWTLSPKKGSTKNADARPRVDERHDPHFNPETHTYSYSTDDGTLVTDLGSADQSLLVGLGSGAISSTAASAKSGTVASSKVSKNASSADTNKNDELGRAGPRGRSNSRSRAGADSDADASSEKKRPGFWDRMKLKGRMLRSESVPAGGGGKDDTGAGAGGSNIKSALSKVVEKGGAKKRVSIGDATTHKVPANTEAGKSAGAGGSKKSRLMVPVGGLSGFEVAKTNLNSNMSELQAFLRAEKAANK
eukprot:CAMPEP_0178996260 /NCGR_PEP_ID=MMETSP0795-20121207/8278_1 /TAXON_ID=88552 /ORGANISM="Amoebophrya sp., Strain Ameob2" /LENGTH=1476 /DNA_ID=CAMNT_0020688647 /DNA_START=255 /DNA_END=4687 /DNA_ORIENTATION=-